MSKLDEQTLSTLFRDARAGDQHSYTQFLHSLVPTLRGMVSAMIFSVTVEDREDIVQEILFAIHRKGHTWLSDKPLLPWIYAVARHKIFDFGRAKSKHLQDIAIDSVHEIEFEFDDPQPKENIEQHIQQLGGKYSQVLWSLVVEDKSIGDTAHALNMSENAVRITFHRACKKLQTQLRVST